MKYLDTKSCTSKCRSAQHASELIATITQTGDTHTLLSAVNQCYNCHKIHDNLGRYLLHMAAACGRSELVEWLVKFKKSDMQLKTLENGWTPAHCAAFYGHIDTLLTLIKLGANLIKNDYDRLTPMEHLCVDKWQSVKDSPFSTSEACDVYSWGSNENFNLGIGHDMKKPIAEAVEFFKKSDTSISQVVMSKFHTVFLASSGQVFTCGFGISGRLGHGDELTLMKPKLVEAIREFKCVQVAASRDNSYFLMFDGSLYGCGSNLYQQLGQMGPEGTLTPKMINLGKRFKARKIKHIECSKFHCVLLTDTNEVFTFGLNAGQLGHPNETVEAQTAYNSKICYISEPRHIAALNEPGLKITQIACSDACTLALQLDKNIIHLFTAYKPRRLFHTNQTNSSFKKLRIHGGRLDTSTHAHLKQGDTFHDPILIVGLTESNQLFTWRENDPVWRKITWTNNKKILVADFDLNLQGLILCTVQGTCYMSSFSRSASKPHSPSDSVNSKTEQLDLNQVPFVNRCFHVVCDKKARNFFALQQLPTDNMRHYVQLHKSLFADQMDQYLNENVTKSEESDSFHSYSSAFSVQKSHDIELKYNGSVFCLNKFILFSRSPKFFDKVKPDLDNPQLDLEAYFGRKYSEKSFDLLMRYIYTGRCSAELISSCLRAGRITSEAGFLKLIAEFKDLAVEKFGFKELKLALDQNNFVKLVKELNLNSRSNEEKFELASSLLARLIDNPRHRRRLHLSRGMYPGLYDCQIRCSKGEVVACHKCVLVARSEYFQNMLLGCWMESSQQVVELPFDADLMQILVDYLYTDDIHMEFVHASDNLSASVKSRNEREIEVLFNLFILADQMLVERLKNVCEFRLANLVNLKNVVEVLEFANDYNAKQLKDFALEFVVCNLVTLLEAKQLEAAGMDLLKEVATFYRSYFPLVGYRVITPYSTGGGVESIELIPQELLFDQRFVDGGHEEESVGKRKSLLSQETSPTPAMATTVIEARLAKSVGPEETGGELKEADQKWEKVKKKNNRRRTSEKDLSTPTVSSSKDVCAVEEASFLNSPQSLEKEVPAIRPEEEMWPSLSDMTVVKKKEPILIQQKKPLRTIKKQQQHQGNTPERTEESVKGPAITPAWGGAAVTREKNNVERTSLSLLDVMNEEMKKLKVASSNESQAVNKKSFTNKSPSIFKVETPPVKTGWNVTTGTTPSTPACSIANIIEMETRSKAQYKKLTSRSLNTIQLEEAAVERIKKYYDVDNVFDMTIKIEVIDESEFAKNCAPLWKKK